MLSVNPAASGTNCPPASRCEALRAGGKQVWGAEAEFLAISEHGMNLKIAIINKEISVYQISDHMWYKNRFRDINRI